MAPPEDVKARSAMSMLGLLLFLSLAFLFLFSWETFRNMLKMLIIVLLLFASLAVASTPRPINKPGEVEKNGTI